MTVGLLLLLFLFPLALATVVLARTVRRRLAGKRFQFSVRTLLLTVTGVAVLLSITLSWDYWTYARITWLAPTSPEAAALVSEPTIVEEGERYRVTFRPRFRDLNQLQPFLQKAYRGPGGGGYRSDYSLQEVTLEPTLRVKLEAELSALQTNDVPQPGWYAIRGRVIDSQGQPVPNVAVDVRGVSIHSSGVFAQAREDGIFFLPFQAANGSRCYLYVAYGTGSKLSSQNTRTFALDPAQRTMSVIIRLH